MLNFLRIAICAVIAITYSLGNLSATEKIYNLHNQNLKFDVEYKYVNEPLVVSKNNKFQMTEWIVSDSLANALSYMDNNIEPFGVDPFNPNYIFTIRRGATNDDGTSNDPLSKNNLFLSYSTDYGKTWATATKVYDYIKDGFGQGRYPSLHVQALDPVDNNYVVSFVGTIVNEQTSSWNGYITGIALVNDNLVTPGVVNVQDDITIDGVNYGIGQYIFNANLGIFEKFPSPTQTLGYSDGSTFRTIFPTPLRTVPFVSNAENVKNNNNTAIVATQEVISVSYDIPEILESDNFETSSLSDGSPDSVHYRSSYVQDIIIGADGNSYMLAFNKYKDDGSDRFVAAVAKSTDEGATWSEFEDFPESVVSDYVGQNWEEVTNSSQYFYLIGYSNELYVQDENNYSIILILREDASLETGTNKNGFLARNDIVELYKEDGEFGVRNIKSHIAGFTNIFSNVAENTTTLSPMDYEMQLAVTYDKQNYYLKWVEPQDIEITPDEVDPNRATLSMTHSDVFISTKPSKGGSWTEPANITDKKDTIMYKGTWIPPFIPNDFNNVMLMRLRTEGAMDILTQRQYLLKQYVETSLISADDLNSVESNRELSNKIITNLYPNPAKSDISFDLNFEEMKNIEVELVDMNGNESVKIYNGQIMAGTKSFQHNVKDLSQGSYVLKVTFDGIVVSQILKVVK